MPKMHLNTFGGLALPGHARGAHAHFQTPWPQWGPTSKGREKRGGGLFLKETEDREEKREKRKGRGGNPPIKVSRVKDSSNVKECCP